MNALTPKQQYYKNGGWRYLKRVCRSYHQMTGKWPIFEQIARRPEAE